MLTIANTQKLKQKREFKQEEKTQIQIQNEINDIAKWEAGQYVEGRYLISIVDQIPQNVNSNKKYK